MKQPWFFALLEIVICFARFVIDSKWRIKAWRWIPILCLTCSGISEFWHLGPSDPFIYGRTIFKIQESSTELVKHILFIKLRISHRAHVGNCEYHELWNIGMVLPIVETLECWHFGMLRYWNCETLKCWNVDFYNDEHFNFRKLAFHK